MQKSVVIGMVGLAAVAGVSAFAWTRARGVLPPTEQLGSNEQHGAPKPSDILVGHDAGRSLSGVSVRYPYEAAVFPPESIPPTFTWFSSRAEVDTWLVHATFEQGEPIQAVVTAPEWTPGEQSWKTFKTRSSGRPARVAVLGVVASAPRKILVGGTVTLTISEDPVGAPLFYREVQLPFIQAVKDPARIRWRFGTIDSPSQPPIVLDRLPVCGNCHSFSANGRVLGMDVDYANDKGSYVLTETGREMVLDRRNVISWSEFRRKDEQPTFGLLSQVSPDGRFAVSTVKDRSVFVPKPDIMFSQLFFPLKGILASYDRETGRFAALPGADDPAYVHSNPVWSPDGKEIVFARSKAYELKYLENTTTALLRPEECQEFLGGGKTFRFDLYRVPFNGGKGGQAVPIAGASGNGRSNFFAKYSPDGKWIVFCQANSFMLLQPDSELYIIPAQGGAARRLACNTSRMNSWHSWSPNGKWLVFSSKAHSAFTQLFLTHMDEQGNSSPPVVLSQFTASDRAANIPEFVNVPPGSISRIREQFVDDISYVRTAMENVKASDPEAAALLYRKALAINPNNAEAHAFLGGILTDQGKLAEAREHLSRALRLSPRDGNAHYNLGNALAKEQKYDQAMRSWKKAIELDPKNSKAKNNLGSILLGSGRTSEAEQVLRGAVEVDPMNADARTNLGHALSKLGRREQAVEQWKEALELNDSNFEAHQRLGGAMLDSGDLEGAIRHFESARRLSPNDAACLLNLGTAYAQKGDTSRAVEFTHEAANVARASGQRDVEQECLRRLRQYDGRGLGR